VNSNLRTSLRFHDEQAEHDRSSSQLRRGEQGAVAELVRQMELLDFPRSLPPVDVASCSVVRRSAQGLSSQHGEGAAIEQAHQPFERSYPRTRRPPRNRVNCAPPARSFARFCTLAPQNA